MQYNRVWVQEFRASFAPMVKSRIFTGYGIYHVSGSGHTSWYNYAKAVLRYTGSKTKVIPISSEELSRPARRPAMSVLDNSKFMKLARLKMRNWKYALKEYLA